MADYIEDLMEKYNSFVKEASFDKLEVSYDLRRWFLSSLMYKINEVEVLQIHILCGISWTDVMYRPMSNLNDRILHPMKM